MSYFFSVDNSKKKQGKFALTERLAKNTKQCQPNNKIILFFKFKNMYIYIYIYIYIHTHTYTYTHTHTHTHTKHT